jgi:hypothetical protein
MTIRRATAIAFVDGRTVVPVVRRATFQVVAIPLRMNQLVPFSTRLADDGLVHVRAWTTPAGAVLLVAELDWALLVADRSDAYFGPGIFTYPEYALGAARAACTAAGLGEPSTIVVRMPDPPGERFAVVDDPDDPQAWPDVPPTGLSAVLGGADPSGPPPGAYVRRVVEAWCRSGVLPG